MANERKYSGRIDHSGHQTYRIGSASSADSRRWCIDCQQAYNPP